MAAASFRRYILGLSAYYHDAAAALLRDGDIVAAAQEERFTRRKNDPDFPRQAADFCLRQAGLRAEQLDAVVFYDKPVLKFARLLETYLAVAPGGWRTFPAVLSNWLGEKLDLRKTIRSELPELRPECPILFTAHHQAHAASAFYPSPFREAAILTIDGVGEWATTSIGWGRGHQIRLEKELRFPHSLGLLYSAFTDYCGFRINSGEYKLMGLAPYGQPTYVDQIYEHLIDLKPDGSFWLNLDYFDFLAGTTMSNERFHRLFGGSPRRPEGSMERRFMDVARSIQVVTEEVMMRLARHTREVTGQSKLCLAGGVALNCVANGRIFKEKIFDELWIQPAAGDAGGALGAALCAWHEQQGEGPGADAEGNGHKITPHPGPLPFGRGEGERTTVAGIVETLNRTMVMESNGDAMHGALLGPEYSEEEIDAVLREQGAVYRKFSRDEMLEETARLLVAGKVIGWFQGRMEFGPRALGNRSILGDARSPAMQSVMNLKVKFRESFRPFAPIVRRERVAEYFELDADSPYMLLVAPIRSELRRSVPARLEGLELLKAERSTLPAVTHVDFSARIQTVAREANALLYELLLRFERATGCGVLVNTSFNIRGEPIVCTPQDAYRCFVSTEMDYLVMGNTVLERTAQPAPARARRVEPQLD
jgi:carbamoyltransferase